MLEKLPGAVGHALREQRAGLENTAFRLIDLRAGMGALEVKSLAFVDHAPIPAQYTADGPGISPPLQWIGVPSDAASLVLIVEDADAPTPHPLVHAIVIGLDGADAALAAQGMADGVGKLFEHGTTPEAKPKNGIRRARRHEFLCRADRHAEVTAPDSGGPPRPGEVSAATHRPSGLLFLHRLFRLRGRRLGGFRDQLLVELIDRRVVLGQLSGNIGTHAICAALGADGQGIERAGLGAGAENAGRIEKSSEVVGNRHHPNLSC